MVTRQDRIADYAQNVAEQLTFRELYDNEEAKANLKNMAEAVAATVATYEDTVNALREFTISGETKAARDVLAEHIREVNLKEHEADIVEAEAAKFVPGRIHRAGQAAPDRSVPTCPCEVPANSRCRRGCTDRPQGTFACSYGSQHRRTFLCSTDGLARAILSSSDRF